MTLEQLLARYGVENEGLLTELTAEVIRRERESFDKGVEEGRATQAILEVQGRKKFLAELRAPGGGLSRR